MKKLIFLFLFFILFAWQSQACASALGPRCCMVTAEVIEEGKEKVKPESGDEYDIEYLKLKVITAEFIKDSGCDSCFYIKAGDIFKTSSSYKPLKVGQVIKAEVAPCMAMGSDGVVEWLQWHPVFLEDAKGGEPLPQTYTLQTEKSPENK